MNRDATIDALVAEAREQVRQAEERERERREAEERAHFEQQLRDFTELAEHTFGDVLEKIGAQAALSHRSNGRPFLIWNWHGIEWFLKRTAHGEWELYVPAVRWNMHLRVTEHPTSSDGDMRSARRTNATVLLIALDRGREVFATKGDGP